MNDAHKERTARDWVRFYRFIMFMLLTTVVVGVVSTAGDVREWIATHQVDTVLVIDSIFPPPESQPVRLIRIPPDEARQAVVHDTAWVDRWHPPEIITVRDTAWLQPPAPSLAVRPSWYEPLRLPPRDTMFVPRGWASLDAARPRLWSMAYFAVGLLGGAFINDQLSSCRIDDIITIIP